ncbi:MAG: hypothetical protein ACREVL_13345 [Solimonas sp.]
MGKARVIKAAFVVFGVLGAAFSGVVATAEEPILVAPLVRYEDGVGTTEVRSTCDWNQTIVNTLVARSKGRVATTSAELDKAHGKTLDLWIQGVHSVGGGGYAGPSWGLLRGELWQDGKIIGRFQQTKETMSRFRFTGCSALDKVGEALGRFTANWLVATPEEKQKFFYGTPLDSDPQAVQQEAR